MDKNLHNIEELFKSTLDDNEERPSEKVWSAVDSRLDKDKIANIKRKYDKLKRVAFLLLLLLIGFGIYELNNRRTGNDLTNTNRNNTDKQKAQNNNTDNAVPADQHIAVSQDQTVSKNINNIYPVIVEPNNPAVIKNIPAGNFFASQQQSLFINSTDYSQKRKKTRPEESTQYLLVDNSSDQINNPLTFLRQSDSPLVKRINIPVFLTPDRRNLLQLYTSTKKEPFIDAKVIATQPTKKKEVKPSRFSITAFYSPDIASYHLEEDQPGNQLETASKIGKGERHEFSSTSGVLLDYNLNKHWSLQSGLSFSNTNIKINPKTIYAQNDNNGNVKYRVNISSGYGYILPSFQNAPVIGDSLKITAATHKLRYIGIPIIVKYSAGKGRLRFEATAGVTANILSKGKLETEVKKGSNDEVDVLNNIQGLKSVYFSGLAGAGVAYKLTKKFSVSLMPTARFALTAINKGNVVRSYPNSFGLAGSVTLRF